MMKISLQISVLFSSLFAANAIAANFIPLDFVAGKTTVVKMTDDSGIEVTKDYTITSSKITLAPFGGKTVAIGGEAGTHQIVATHKTDSSKNEIFTATVVPGAATRLVVVSGNLQKALIGTEVPDPLVVKAVDNYSNGVKDVQISWSSTSGTASFSSAQLITAEDGTASSLYTVGQTAKNEQVSATGPASLTKGRTATFTETASATDPNVASYLDIYLPDSSTTQSAGFRATVTVKTETGTTAKAKQRVINLSGYKNSSCSIPASPVLSGEISNITTNGIAEFTNIKYNSPAYIYIKAETEGLKPACSKMIVVSKTLTEPSNAVGSLEFTSLPSEVKQGTSFSPQINVQVIDLNGKVYNSPVSVSLSAHSDSACQTASSSSISGTTTVLSSLGSAIYSAISYPEPGSIYIKAVTGNVVACSPLVSIKPDNSDVPSSLRFSALSGTGEEDKALSPIKVVVLNDKGAVVQSNSLNVLLSIHSDSSCSSNVAGTSIIEPNPVTTQSGYASFNNVVYSDPGTIYFKASLGSISTCSSAVGITQATSGSPYQIKITQDVAGTYKISEAIPSQLKVEVRDINNLKTAMGSLPVSMSFFSDAACSVSAPVPSKSQTSSNGVVSFSLSPFSDSGNYYAKVSSGTLNTACSSLILVKASACSTTDVANSSAVIGDKDSGCYASACQMNYYLEEGSCVAPYAAKIVKVSGDNQVGQKSAQLAKSLKVKILDQKDVPVSNYSVSFSSLNGGVLSASSSLTGADGTASVSFTLGSSLGSYSVRAFNDSLTSIKEVTFNHTAIERDGFLDVSFSGDGVQSNPTFSSSVNSTLAQSTRKVITVGYYEIDPYLTRYNEDGSLDTSFGVGGYARPSLSSLFGTSSVSAQRAVILPDDRIMLMGSYYNGSSFVYVSVLTSNGEIDSSFNGGAVTSNSSDSIQSFSLTSDSVFIFGYKYNQSMSRYDTVTMKINLTGSLDSSFGAGGILTGNYAEQWDYSRSGTVNSDGTISLILDGSNYVHLSASGSVILTKNFATEMEGDWPELFAFKSDGKKLVYSYGAAPTLRQFNSDMTIDTSFGNNGKVILSFDSLSSWVYVQNLNIIGDKIVLIGTSDYWNGSSSVYQHSVLRLNSNGSVDTSYGINGKFNYSGNEIQLYSDSVNFDSSGKMVMGFSQYDYNSGSYQEIVVRVTGTVTNGPVPSLPAGTMVWDQSLPLTATGGKGPYTYEVLSGPGIVDSETGIFTAGTTSGLVTIQVTDSEGKIGTTKVNVVKFTIAATKGKVYPGQTSSISVSSGNAQPPFTYSFVTNFSGAVINASGTYTSGNNFGGNDIILLTDSTGNSNTVSIAVAKALTLSPDLVEVGSSKTTTFVASGGAAPYTYSIYSSGGIGSTINSTTGVFTAGTNSAESPVREQIMVSDSEGNKAYSGVDVSRLSGVIVSQKTLTWPSEWGTGTKAYIGSPVILSEGKALFFARYKNAADSSDTFKLFKLKPDGTTDSTYGTLNPGPSGGYYLDVTAHLTGHGTVIGSVIDKTRGKIYIATRVTNNASWKIIKLNFDGTKDSTFGTNGVMAFSRATPAVTCDSENPMLTSSGSLMFGAACATSTALTRYIVVAKIKSDGTLDSSYGNSSGVTFVSNSGRNSLDFISNGKFEALSDGSVLFPGKVYSPQPVGNAIFKVTATGNLSSSFGSSGDHIWFSNSGQTHRISVDSEDKFYVSEYTTSKISSFWSDGMPNLGFGSYGVAYPSINSHFTPAFLGYDGYIYYGNTYFANGIGRVSASTGIVDPKFGTSTQYVGYTPLSVGWPEVVGKLPNGNIMVISNLNANQQMGVYELTSY